MYSLDHPSTICRKNFKLGCLHFFFADFYEHNPRKGFGVLLKAVPGLCTIAKSWKRFLNGYRVFSEYLSGLRTVAQPSQNVQNEFGVLLKHFPGLCTIAQPRKAF